MSLYDEQVKQRIKSDDDIFAEAFADMSQAILGERIIGVLENDRLSTQNTIGKIMRYYGQKVPEIPENIVDFNDQLDYMLGPCGMMRRTVNLEGAWYKNAIGAFLAILKDNNRCVAVLPHRLKGYYFQDPITHKRIHLNKKTAELLETEAICFYRPLPLKRLTTADLLKFSISCLSLSHLRSVLIFTVISTLLGFLTPILSQIIYSYVIEVNSLRLFLSVFICVFCVGVSSTLISTMKSMTMNCIKVPLETAVSAAVMMRVLALPLRFFRSKSVGELSSCMGYFSSLCISIVDTILATGFTSLFSLAYITQMIKYGPGLVVPGLIVIVVTVVFSYIVTLAQIKVRKLGMELRASEREMSLSLISGIQKIKLSGAEKRAFAKWAHIYAKGAKNTYDPPQFLKVSSVISTAISLIGTVVIYYFTIKTKVSLADYYAFNSAYGMVMGAFSSLVGMVSTFSAMGPMLDMIKPIMNELPEVSDQKRVVDNLSGNIEMTNVTFRYQEDGPNVIDGLSMKIRAGQYVAIVGKTGCGKSTLVRLLLGFEKPQKGAVYYDGKDLQKLDIRSVRRNIGTVMQDGKLFTGDIFSNIVISAPYLTQEDAWEAAELAGLTEDIRSMPMGMNTIISEGSGGISGGQKQRLMIARAIVHKPKILIFDEATSALDNITQKHVSDSLDQLKCTRIVIAHRLSTIRNCHRIIVIDGGRIIEDGTYDELIEKQGFFADLVERQKIHRE